MTSPVSRHPDPRGSIPVAQRMAILQNVLTSATTKNARVVAQSATSAKLVVGDPANHNLHALISIFLCGLWIPVWILIAATRGEKTTSVYVDRHGGVIWAR